ncbi:MAG TPA: hypothetical protein VFP34_04850 [Microlunatus sp.]|nr:hypothetical protein [Microlunatus sp.]
MAYYIFNVGHDQAPRAIRLLHAQVWPVRADEPHSDALAGGDLILVYLAAPTRMFIARAKLASPVHGWSAAELQAQPGDTPCGVSLAEVEVWDAPVAMQTVLARIDRSAGARADFEFGVVRITRGEYETAVSVARGAP